MFKFLIRSLDKLPAMRVFQHTLLVLWFFWKTIAVLYIFQFWWEIGSKGRIIAGIVVDGIKGNSMRMLPVPGPSR